MNTKTHKTMINLFASLLMIIATLAGVESCGKSNETPVEKGAKLELSSQSVNFKDTKSSQNVKATISGEWTVEIAAPADQWISVTLMSNAVSVVVDDNPDSEIREGVVTFRSGSATQKLDVRQLGKAPAILVSSERFDLPFYESDIKLTVTSNVEYDVSTQSSDDWLAATTTRALMEQESFNFKSGINLTGQPRSTTITIAQKGGDLKQRVEVEQAARVKGYTEGEIGDMGEDMKITVASGTASDWQDGAESIKQGKIEYSFDNDLSSLYHSRWGSDTSTKFPVELTYTFANSSTLDYIVYSPRKDGGQTGCFGRFELWLAEGSATNYVKYGDYDFEQSGSDSTIEIEPAKENICGAKFVVASGQSNTVSCAEMTFYTHRSGGGVSFDSIFADPLLTTLNDGIGYKEVSQMENEFFQNIAYAILDGVYDTSFRVQSYQPYEPLSQLRAWMKTSDYNRYENPTGIYFKPGDAIVIVGDTHGQKVSLRVRDFTYDDQSEVDYTLSQGINKIHIGHKGLGYIAYYTPDFESCGTIDIHIPSGTVNGCFDKNKHTNNDWKKLIEGAVYEFFDLKGDYVNLCYSTADLRKKCPDRGRDLIDNYDKLINLQWDLMGLKKYDRCPKNHMFGRRVKSGFYADGTGAGFDYDGLCVVDHVLNQDVWGIAHEFGHVNQIRPGLKWVSTTELTNNIYSICSRYVFNPEYMNLEMESLPDCQGNTYTGGRYGSFLNAAIRDGEHWLCQRGPDNQNDYMPGMSRDHFVKLIPIWQMLLYYRYMPNSEWYTPDWYGDIAELVRNDSWYDTATNGELQVRFLKNVMDMVHQDLSDFFVTVGMLTPIDEADMDDYSREPMRITQAMCDELKEYAKQYPKPATPVLYYLSYFSREAFANNLPVEGKYAQGVKSMDGQLRIATSDWKNVAVFEAYAGDELKYISMVCSDDKTGNYTYAIYPEGSTRLEAVGVDGVRTLVWGTR